MSEAKIIHGDNRETLATLPERHFHCCVTSPPYWGLRDYGVDGQIGLEGSPEGFVAAMVDVFRGVWRVLRDDGVLWLNLGDSYNAYNGNAGPGSGFSRGAACDTERPRLESGHGLRTKGLKPKDLVGIPWRVAFALQEDGWYLRDAIIWHKPAPMPGSQRDRCTSSYEFIFQLTKSRRYFFDIDAIRTPAAFPGDNRAQRGDSRKEHEPFSVDGGSRKRTGMPTATAITPRNVWTISPSPFKGAHFATFPVELPTRCIKASTSSKGCCSACGAPWQRITERTALKRERPNELTKRTGEDGTGNHCANTVAGVEARTIGWEPTCDCGAEVAPCRVLDPFNGAGTTGVACRRLGVDYVGCELNQEYIDMSLRRLAKEANRDSKLKPVKAAVGQAELF